MIKAMELVYIFLLIFPCGVIALLALPWLLRLIDTASEIQCPNFLSGLWGKYERYFNRVLS